MSEEIQLEFINTLSKELSAEAIKVIFFSTKNKKRKRDLTIAIIFMVFYAIFFPIILIDFDVVNFLLSLIILGNSVFLFACYFWGYSFPKSMYWEQVKNLSNPPSRRYVFFQTQFVVMTDQSTETFFYSNIVQLIDYKDLLIFITSNQEFVIDKKCALNNCEDLIMSIRKSSNCKYSNNGK